MGHNFGVGETSKYIPNRSSQSGVPQLHLPTPGGGTVAIGPPWAAAADLLAASARIAQIGTTLFYLVKQCYTHVSTATASRLTATLEQNNIYCRYKGWLPENTKQPVYMWQLSWIETNILNNSFPFTTVTNTLQPPPNFTASNPPFDITDPATSLRLNNRENSC